MELKQTGSQTVGPFFAIGMYDQPLNDLIQAGTQGEKIIITGRVLDGDGEPIRDAAIEIWQADSHGIYNHPEDPRQTDADPNFMGFGRSDTASEGRYRFKTIRPGVVPFNDEQNQAPHILVRVFMRGTLLHANTRLYFSDEAATESDPVLQTVDEARRSLMIACRDDTEGMPTYHFDIRMQGEQATPFFEP